MSRSTLKLPESLTRKIHSSRAVTSVVRTLKRSGKRIVFTNGCFDLLHLGHVILLERAKRYGDVLVVALNSDRSIRTLKGPHRPVVSQRDRSALVAALSCVDLVTVFDDSTPHALIAKLVPDVLVKGSDWSLRQIVGQDVVRRHKGRVVRIPLIDGYSTTQLVEDIGRSVGGTQTSNRLA